MYMCMKKVQNSLDRRRALSDVRPCRLFHIFFTGPDERTISGSGRSQTIGTSSKLNMPPANARPGCGGDKLARLCVLGIAYGEMRDRCARKLQSIHRGVQVSAPKPELAENKALLRIVSAVPAWF